MAENKIVVLVTGATQGIGLEIVRTLAAADDFKVYGTIRSTSDTSQLLEVKENYPDSVAIAELDVTDDRSVVSAIKSILNEESRIDVLVNNACHVAVGSVESCSLTQQMKSMDVNYWGVVRLLQACLPTMRKMRSGRIINISSVAGIDPYPPIETYAATKFALEGLSESLATSLSPFGIRVSLVEPGGVKTKAPENAELGERDLGIDDPWSNYCKKAKEKMIASYHEGATEPADVAKLILEIITKPDPHLRYQVGDFAASIATDRFSDPTGDAPIQAKRKMLVEMGLYQLIGNNELESVN